MAKPFFSLLVLLTLWCQSPVVRADGQRDHDRARAALRAGEILPLTQILERVARQQPGQVLEVELERKHDLWIYELKLIQSSGALVKLKVDARDGSLLQQKTESR